MRLLVLLISIIFLLPSSALAGPALPQPIQVQQPDGSFLELQLRGDEFQNWMTDATGFTVVQDPVSKQYEYALPKHGALVPSGRVAGRDAPPPAVSPDLRPAANETMRQQHQEMLRQHLLGRMPGGNASSELDAAGTPSQLGTWSPVPVSGPRKLLIVLVAFADRGLSTSRDDWSNIVFSTSQGVKSVANFYNDNSHGALTISPVAHTQGGAAGVVSVAIGLNHPNSGSNFNYSEETAWLNAALAQASTHVNFNALDTNGDGWIQTSEAVLYFIPAGYEASGSSKKPSIWAHAWGGLLTAGPKFVSQWAMNGELNQRDARHSMGVIAHELGHQMCGMPDLYDIGGVNAGMGIFSIMAAGGWGQSSWSEDAGTTPTAFDAWTREFVGWDTPVRPSQSGVRTFGSVLSRTSVKLSASPTSTEYFLVENRQPTGWDTGMTLYTSGNGGLLIQHVDTTVGNPGWNNINQSGIGPHQGVIPEQASTTGCNMLTTGCPGSATTMFYGGNNNEFDDNSSPYTSQYHNGTASGFGVTQVSASGEIMRAYITTSGSANSPMLTIIPLMMGE